MGDSACTFSNYALPTLQLQTVLGAAGPIPEAAAMPFIIPALWDIIFNHLFVYTPNNDWMVNFNPHKQHLKGDGAKAFLHYREVCKGFDEYMLHYMT